MTERRIRGEPNVRRWTEQRWALDNVIRAVGIDWDQPRSFYLNVACGIEASADFAAIRERVKKYADVEPAFAGAAQRREGKARAAEADGALVTARDNYFMAAIHWGSAQWSRHENDVDESRLQQEQARLLRPLRSACGTPHRAGIHPVQGEIAARLVSPAAGLRGRPHPGGDLVPRHGHLQGGVRRAEGRPVARTRHRGACARRAGPGRMPRARSHGEHGELDGGRQSRGRLAGRAAGDRS